MGDVRTVRADDVDEHAGNLSGWQQRYDQLARGTFTGTLRERCWSDTHVFREATSRAVRQRCIIKEDSLWIGLTLRHDGTRIEGSLVGDGGLMVCGRAEEFDLVTPNDHDIVGVVVARAALEQQAERARVDLPWSAMEAPGWLPAAPGADHGLRAAVLDCLADPRGGPGEVLAAVVAARRPLPDVAGPPARAGAGRRSGAATLRRALVDRIVSEYEAQLATDPSLPPPSVADLCARHFVSRRTLQYAFEEVVGLSPHACLRSLHVNHARRLLLAGASVTQAAAGFGSPSQFARDYRAHFGERPSDTRTRAVRRDRTDWTST